MHVEPAEVENHLPRASGLDLSWRAVSIGMHDNDDYNDIIAIVTILYKKAQIIAKSQPSVYNYTK